MYKVIKYFTDLQDNNFAYNVGDTFPHKGKEVDEKRIKELSTSNNRRGTALIELVDEKKAEKAETAEEPEEPLEIPFADDGTESVEEEAEKPNEEPKEAPKKRGRKKNA